MRLRSAPIAIALLLSTLVPLSAVGPGAGAASAAPKRIRVDLRVDTDRNGRIDGRDEHGEDRAGNRAGALFLANIDDDSRRCRTRRPDGTPLAYAVMARCNDAADRRVDGPADALDLARVVAAPVEGLSGTATGRIVLGAVARRHVNVFVRLGHHWRYVRPTTVVPAAALRSGLTLGVEGRDVLRRTSGWNGTVHLRLTVVDRGRAGSDTVALHQAPVLTTDHTQPVRRLLVSVFDRQQAAQLEIPSLPRASHQLARSLVRLSKKRGIKEPIRLHGGEMFPQDIVEPMYAAMPAPGGGTQAMDVLVQSPQDWRDGSRELYTRLRGRDVAVLHLPEDPDGRDGIGQTLSSTGNLETIPPYSYRGHHYPRGRVIMGRDPKTGDRPAPSLLRLLRAQGMQAPLLVDTGWTFVSHVDESLQFLPADTARGWRVAVADPAAGLRVLRRASRDGHGDRPLFSRHPVYDRLTTIDDYLHDPDHVLVDESRIAARHVAANIRLLKRETGISEADIVRVPALFGSIDLQWGHQAGTPHTSPLTALLPDAVNGIVLDRHHVAVPRQDGPRIAGRDVFANAVRTAYRRAGISTSFVADHLYSLQGGEIHCATNALRVRPARWWRS